MKKFKEFLFGLCFRLGFVPQRVTPPGYVHFFIEHLPVSIKEYELIKHVDNAVRANNHRYYEAMLKGFIKEGNVDIEKATFIVGKGMGETSLNIYRKAIIHKKAYFEKVFFSARLETETAEWFQQHVYGRLKGHIGTAALATLLKGNFITVAYYEFLALSPFPLSLPGDYDEFVKLTIDLYLLSNAQSLDMEGVYTPAHIHDFRFHFQYQRNVCAATQQLRQAGIDQERLIDIAESSKKILTHGDINPGNAFNGPVLIDWDSFGIYPVGMEVAYLYYRMPVRDQQYGDPKKWLERHYKTTIDPSDWPSFESNFFFFLYVFAFHLLQTADYADLERQIVENIKTHEKTRKKSD